MMDVPFRLLQLVLPILLIMGAGYLLRRSCIFTQEADESLLGVLVNLLVPCLALDVIIGNEALLQSANLIFPPLAGFVSVALGVGLSFLAAKLFLKNRLVQRTFACVTGLQNYSYIPLPLCQMLFDRKVVGVLLAFNLGVEIALWSVAAMTLAGHKSASRWWAPLWNAPIIAIVGSIILNLLHAEKWIPSPLNTTWHMLGVCAVPLGLLLSGSVLADYAKPHVFREGLASLLLAVVLRLFLLPALILGLAGWFPLPLPLRLVLIVQAAMPSAVFPIILTKIHHGDMPTALRVIFGTTLLSLITIPIWLSLGLSLIHAK